MGNIVLGNAIPLFAGVVLVATASRVFSPVASGSVPEHGLAADIDPRAFLQEYCIGCHGEEKQKGDRRFDHLNLDFSDGDTAFEWQEILDMVNLGEMPPEDETQPSSDEVSQVISWITPRLDRYYASEIERETTGLRRMNAFQYRKTVGDLLGLNMASFDPTASFPSEERQDGFENVSSKLVTSRYLMERYLEAASESIDKVVDIPAERPLVNAKYGADDFWKKRVQFRARTYYVVNQDGKYVEVGHGDKGWERVYPRPFEGAPVGGYYTITVKAEAVGRENPYDPSLFNVDFSEPIEMEIFANDKSSADAKSENPTNRHIETIALEDNTPREYKVRVWLDKGYNFGFRYSNGPTGHKRSVLAVHEKYHPETLTSNYRDEFAQEPSEELENYLSDVYAGPRMRIYWASIEGPETGVWPPRNYRELLGSEKHGEIDEDPIGAIRRFATKAFRRPALNSEVERYFRFFEMEMGKGLEAMESLLNTYKAIMCSPHFLYIGIPLDEAVIEFGELSHTEIEAYQLASRLSYFLWGTMPDEELMNAARSGAILKPIEMKYQALRMLRDPRSDAFVSNFTDGWLGLHKLGQILPDPVKYEFYESDGLERSMRLETRTFFRHLLDENRDIAEFLNGGYTFVDRNLAKLYGLDPTGLGHDPVKVAFDGDSFRGGILGQAGIHTVTANGVDTSPVVRGVWVLENLLGTPPSPPPPDVPALEPDIRGATSIPDQLAKHRNIQSCNECHRKIDPLGFALESFDAIGGFRRFYDEGQEGGPIPVATSGKLPSGETFSDIRGLRELLVDRKEQFARCLTEKLLMYALGREILFSDRPQVDRIVEELDRRGGGLQDLVEIVVTSEVFLAE